MNLLQSFVSACIITSILSLLLGAFVFLKGYKKSLNRVWAFLSLSVSLWSFGLGMMVNSNSEQQAMFWLTNVHYLGATFIPVLFMHFSFLLLEDANAFKKLIRISYFFSFVVLYANFTGNLARVEPLEPFKYYTQPKWFYLFYTSMFFLYVSYALVRIFKSFMYLKGEKRNRLWYFFISMVIGFLCGSTAFFPVFGLPLFPYGMYFISIYAFMTTYAIVRYQLMDINVIIKRSTVYAVMILFITTIYLATIFFFENMLRYIVGYSSLMTRIFAAIIIAFTFLPLRSKVENILDKIFFRTKLEYSREIRNFTDELVTILELRRLMGSIVLNVSKIMKVDFVSLLIYEKKSRDFKVKALTGFSDSARSIRYNNASLIVQWLKSRLKKKKQMALKVYFENKHSWDSTAILTEIKKLNAELFIPLFFSDKLIGILALSEKRSGDSYSSDDLRMLKTLGNQAAIALSNAASYDNLKKNFLGTIRSLATAIEAKDVYTKGHSDRVVRISLEIAKELNIPRDEIDLLKYAGVLHDIGKIAIDDSILRKSEKLSADEFEKIKHHPAIGESIISPIDSLDEVKSIIRHHHEYFDGSGYPDNKQNVEIPLLSRILAVADAFDAMTSARSYRPAKTNKEAINEIINCSGMQFDPGVVEAFISTIDKGIIY